MKLYKHNEEAYNKVMASFKTNNKAAVVHATGSGKTYIIAAVAENFRKVLIVAPNNFVLDETRKVCHSGCEFRTYASVMYDEGEANKYDLIVLDEFHRGGAEKWGVGVQKLIDANPTAKLLGTSATNIRYLDNARNMADELFDGNVVSYLPLREAIDRNILPDPTYVCSIYTLEDTIKTKQKKYEEYKRQSKDVEEAKRKLEGIAKNWDNAGGVSRIINKYITHDMQRIIVFCSKVKRAAEARELLSKWFGLAGFKRVRYYNIDYQEKRLEKEMKDFQEPLGDYDLKVAISVNMLNEGVHIPHVDGVIMLRSTISRIILEQQVGRCLTSNNVDIKPVVLDLVNNIDSIGFDMYNFTDGSNVSNGKEGNEKDGFPFKVIDECRDIRIALQRLDNEYYRKPLGWWTKERCREEALKYKSRVEFSRISQAYKVSLYNGWLDEICGHMVELNHKWTLEEVVELASRYDKLSDFVRDNPKAYKACFVNGWKEIALGSLEKMNKYDYDSVRAIAMQYATRKEFRDNNISAYYYAKRKGDDFLDLVCSHMPFEKKIIRWTKEMAVKKASEYATYKDFIKDKALASYCSRCGRDFFDKVTERFNRVPKRGVWTDEELVCEARKYNRKDEFHKCSSGAFNAARKRGKDFFDMITSHMQKGHRNNKCTKENVIKYAKECCSYKDFRLKDRSYYNYAMKNNFLAEIKAMFDKKAPQ